MFNLNPLHLEPAELVFKISASTRAVGQSSRNARDTQTLIRRMSKNPPPQKKKKKRQNKSVGPKESPVVANWAPAGNVQRCPALPVAGVSIGCSFQQAPLDGTGLRFYDLYLMVPLKFTESVKLFISGFKFRVCKTKRLQRRLQ